MNTKNLIIGTGVLAAYVSYELLKNKEKVVVTSRSIKKKYNNFQYLKIQNKVKFEKLNIKVKDEIEKIIKKHNPNKIFYFAGQSSIIKSRIMKRETIDSHFTGTKNFLNVLKKNKFDCKFFKANSGYIFKPKNGKIDLKSRFSNNNNIYVKAQLKTYKIINKYRNYKLNLFNLVFLQVESPLRPNDYFIKKVCIAAKLKKKVEVGNIKIYRDYSWITEIAKAIILTSSLKPNNFIISAGKRLSGIEILKIAYKLNKLNYQKYFKINKKFMRKNDTKALIGSSDNIKYLKKKFGFEFKIFKKELIKRIYKKL